MVGEEGGDRIVGGRKEEGGQQQTNRIRLVSSLYIDRVFVSSTLVQLSVTRINQSNQSSNHPIIQSVSQSVSQSVNKSINESTNQSITWYGKHPDCQGYRLTTHARRELPTRPRRPRLPRHPAPRRND